MSTMIQTASAAPRAGGRLIALASAALLGAAAMCHPARCCFRSRALGSNRVDDSARAGCSSRDQQARRLLRGAAGRYRRRARRHRHDPAGDGADSASSIHRTPGSGGRLCLSAAGAGGGGPSRDGDRRPRRSSARSRAAGGQGGLRARPRRSSASMPAWQVSERPNIFTTSVAQYRAGRGRSLVEIAVSGQRAYRCRHLQPALSDGGGSPLHPGRADRASLRQSRPAGVGAGHRLGRRRTDRVPDADRITPPVLQPGQGKINPVRIAIDFAPGFATERVTSLIIP